MYKVPTMPLGDGRSTNPADVRLPRKTCTSSNGLGEVLFWLGEGELDADGILVWSWDLEGVSEAGVLVGLEEADSLRDIELVPDSLLEEVGVLLVEGLGETEVV